MCPRGETGDFDDSDSRRRVTTTNVILGSVLVAVSRTDGALAAAISAQLSSLREAQQSSRDPLVDYEELDRFVSSFFDAMK